MDTSTCTFASMTFGYKGSSSSAFGRQRQTVSRSIGVDRSQPGVDIVAFSTPVEPEDDAPYATLEARLRYAGEPMDFLQVTVYADDAPVGSLVSLASSDDGTTPPIELVRTQVTGPSFNRVIRVTQLPKGFDATLTLSFWKNGKRLDKTATLAVDVLRVVSDAGDAADTVAVSTEPDIYGQPAPAGSVGYPVGRASLALQR